MLAMVTKRAVTMVPGALWCSLQWCLLPLLLVDEEDDARSTNAVSSLATLAHTDCRAMKARALLDRPLLARIAGSKGGK